MSGVFHLEVGDDRTATLTFDVPGKRVNIFNRDAFAELERTIDDLAARAGEIGVLILLSGKPGSFIAGADVEEIARVDDPAEAEAGSRLGQRLFAAWEALPFPTVAAIRGLCLGGGTELALASTYRVASDRADTRIGLPEVRLGIVPGWGGSTRLPRLLGLADALDLILTGKNVPAKRAERMGLVDALLPDARFLDLVRDFARERLDRPRSAAAGRGFKELLTDKNPLGRHVVFDQARKKTLASTRGQYPAPLRAIEVVRVGVEEGAAKGFDAEARAVGELAVSATAKNLQHVFHLTEAAKRESGLPGASARPVTHTAVLGAGTMGGGIAQIIAAEADLPVRLKDVCYDALAAGMEHAGALFATQREKRRIDAASARRKMALLGPTLDWSGFSRADLVIEA
ncbi:MAG TPA: enoyl-CoA hydratase-related protein, partial [Thermoanaerobaculia bacterium]